MYHSRWISPGPLGEVRWSVGNRAGRRDALSYSWNKPEESASSSAHVVETDVLRFPGVLLLCHSTCITAPARPEQTLTHEDAKHYDSSLSAEGHISSTCLEVASVL